MKAVILAAGAGTRLRPVTNDIPKVLVEVGGISILDHQLSALLKHGIDQVIITTGPFREKLEKHVKRNSRVSAQFVHNPIYDSTDNIYSLWLARDLIADDMLLLHGDLLFDDVLVSRLVETAGDSVLVNRTTEPPEKDFKALIQNDRIVTIGVDIQGPEAYFCAPMYRFSRDTMRLWLAEIDAFIRRGEVECYAETALNEISGRIDLRPLYFDEFCMEIDTIEDLELARRIMADHRP